ncbi:MAG: hypothetical protein KAI06_00445 [Anaerolineales bacterium]|nr:hypothetical protein [Anaerolineales bacterium]
MAHRVKTFWPAALTLIISSAYILWRLTSFNMDAAALAEIGTRYADLNPDGSSGYDGQFALFVARDPNPQSVAKHLDVPAYRYQRILYPALARFLVGGSPTLIPWSLLLVNLCALVAATGLLATFITERGYPSHYALIYGLWVGLVAAVGLDLHEPLAYGLVILGWFWRFRNRRILGAIALGLALFAKETTVLFWIAALISDLVQSGSKSSKWTLIAGGALFALWQAWLWWTFGSPGIGSGGDMATGFEWIPLMGLLRVGTESIPALILFLVILGPSVIFPTLWGLVSSLKTLWDGAKDATAMALFTNSLAILFIPFSTFREPLGIVRVATGLVLALVLFSVQYKRRKPLNYAMFWIALLVMLLNA